MRTIALTLCSVLAVTAIARADVISTFDSDSEGWRVADLPDSGPFGPALGYYAVLWNSSGGNPGGYLSATDPSGNNFFLDAPAAFLGDKSTAYGQTLSYDLAFPYPVDWTPLEDVILVGGGMTLVANQGPPPEPAWKHYSLTLLGSSGWHIGTGAGPAPTEAELQTVLSDLTALRIRGEYHYGDDLPGLDNVRLATTAVPDGGATLSILGLGLLGMGAARRVLVRQ